MTEPQATPPLPTPLLDRHEALGAKIVEFAGWLMPIQYAGILDEHRAVRAAAGLFDLSHMGELVIEGPGAGAALASALVTDPPSLAVGRAQYSMICAPDGGIMDDLIVYRLAEDRFMVVANASNALVVSDALAQRLEGFAAVLDDRSLATGLVAIQGPRSIAILQPLASIDLAAIRYYGIAEGEVAGSPSRSPEPATPARTASSCSSTSSGQARSGTRSWLRVVSTRLCRSVSAPGTRSASRPGCPCTATSWTWPRTRSRRVSAGS